MKPLQLEINTVSGRTLITGRALSVESLFVQWSCRCLAGGVKHLPCCLNICYNLCAFLWEGKETLVQRRFISLACYQLEVLHSDPTAKILFSLVLPTSEGRRLYHSCDPAWGPLSLWWRQKSLHDLEITFAVSTENCSKALGEADWYKERHNSVCPEPVCDLYSAGSWDGGRCQDLTSCLSNWGREMAMDSWQLHC